MKADDGVQQHDSVVGERVVCELEEGRVAFVAEVFEGADADNAVDFAVEFFPTVQQDLPRA